jgi:hypothetical protein
MGGRALRAAWLYSLAGWSLNVCKVEGYMKREIAAYIAGIIDGEGSIYLERFKSKQRSTGPLRRSSTPYQYRISVCLLMCGKSSVDFIAKATNRSIQTRRLPAKYNEKSFRRTLTAYGIVWRNGFAESLLLDILPYLHCKKRKAVLCLKFQDKYAPGRGRAFQKHLIPKYEALRKEIAIS